MERKKQLLKFDFQPWFCEFVFVKMTQCGHVTEDKFFKHRAAFSLTVCQK